ncbi:NAD(P)-binding protein [Ceraceosorus guamensis]|uniref:NAD(P)-binding protein n=1 Tax=Ceraceosorus guamensis TaxID=1522189 RepID=A0A316W3X5_9BASI|nr:NAD(P)-binding protein [Ceraceosorus guamensis]PWN44419.1 NAD(P)-binding protein [Ceraceosorus guamensis]
MPNEKKQPNVLMVGTGEYTTGFVGGAQSTSDKSNLSMVGTNGDKHVQIRHHFEQNIAGKYRDMDVSYNAFPPAGHKDAEAYKLAIDALSPGDAITIFTPDSTHFDIAKYAITTKKLHVLVTKPATQRLEHHQELASLAKEHGVLCMVEHHKRWDPVYADAKDKCNGLGDLQFFSAYMSQPKTQLKTFKSWAGVDSDISYYLNSHHVDILLWFTKARALPVRVTASASRGVATDAGCADGTEDTITLLVDFGNLDAQDELRADSRGTAVFTASWAAPKGAGVHSEQNFHYIGQRGEIKVDQAHRGYSVLPEDDGTGTQYVNPFYMKYSPDAEGHFDGQNGYGYRSIADFCRACSSINQGRSVSQYDHIMPTIHDTVLTTAILDAGRRSLDERRPVELHRDDSGVWSLH